MNRQVDPELYWLLALNLVSGKGVKKTSLLILVVKTGEGVQGCMQSASQLDIKTGDGVIYYIHVGRIEEGGGVSGQIKGLQLYQEITGV